MPEVEDVLEDYKIQATVGAIGAAAVNLQCTIVNCVCTCSGGSVF